MTDDLIRRAERTEQLRQQRQARIASDLANAERDAPIRARFHAWLLAEGFCEQVTPKPGSVYLGSHTQALWECYLAATLAERGSHAANPS